ncbi:MAG TPA: serine hydrolase domain-containing protein [Gemmatimonadales bacterium]|nr:serine hydrolase domain-containing protein [Gemmatimonadales bacterium]
MTIENMAKLIGLLSLLFVCPAAAQTRAALDSIDRFVRKELARQRIPGMSVAVLRGDSLLLARGYGLANVEHPVVATDSTVYPVGSLSKQFTAAAIVLLSQQRRLGLDDPITRYLPEGRAVWSRVTIRHLLTHTSGVPQDTTLDQSRDYTETELVRSAAQPLEFEPGQLESYSSTGYALLGVIIHRVTGVPWYDFVRDQIFRPLDMRTAAVSSDTTVKASRAAGYYLVNDTLQSPDPVSPSLNSAADCCLSFSVRDLAQWAAGLNHGKVLGRAGLEMSWTPVRLNNGGIYPYGFGWNILQQRGYRRIGHSGAWLGCHATLQRYPDFDLTVIVLLNLGQANSEGIAVGIAGLVEPALTPPHLLATPLKGATPPTSIERLLGAIASGSEGPLATPEFKDTFPGPRRGLIGGMIEGIQTWTPLGCDDVRRRGITRLRSRIEHICYTKGTAKEGSLLFTVLYGSGWRVAGLDNVFGI